MGDGNAHAEAGQVHPEGHAQPPSESTSGESFSRSWSMVYFASGSGLFLHDLRETFIFGEDRDFAILARRFRLHRAVAFEHCAFMHD